MEEKNSELKYLYLRYNEKHKEGIDELIDCLKESIPELKIEKPKYVNSLIISCNSQEKNYVKETLANIVLDYLGFEILETHKIEAFDSES